MSSYTRTYRHNVYLDYHFLVYLDYDLLLYSPQIKDNSTRLGTRDLWDVSRSYFMRTKHEHFSFLRGRSMMKYGKS